MDPNATIRSHNLRGGRSAAKPSLLELFQFSDSFQDLHHQEAGVASPVSPESAVSGYSSGESKTKIKIKIRIEMLVLC